MFSGSHTPRATSRPRGRYVATCTLLYADPTLDTEHPYIQPLYNLPPSLSVHCSCHPSNLGSELVNSCCASGTPLPVFGGAFLPSEDEDKALREPPAHRRCAYHGDGRPMLHTLSKYPYRDPRPVPAVAPIGRSGHVFTAMEGKMVLHGGLGTVCLNDTWEFNPATRRWRELAIPRSPRGPSARRGDHLPSSAFLPPAAYAQAFSVFHPHTCSCMETSPSPSSSSPRHEHLITIGGFAGNDIIADSCIFCGRHESWSPVKFSTPLPAAWGAAAQTLRQPRRLRRCPGAETSTPDEEEEEEEVVVVFGGIRGKNVGMLTEMLILYMERPLTVEDVQAHQDLILSGRRYYQAATMPDGEVDPEAGARTTAVKPDEGAPPDSLGGGGCPSLDGQMLKDAVGTYLVEVLPLNAAPGAAFPPPRRRPCSAVYQGRRLIIFGGRDQHVFFNDLWEWSSDTRTWRDLYPTPQDTPEHILQLNMWEQQQRRQQQQQQQMEQQASRNAAEGPSRTASSNETNGSSHRAGSGVPLSSVPSDRSSPSLGPSLQPQEQQGSAGRETSSSPPSPTEEPPPGSRPGSRAVRVPFPPALRPRPLLRTFPPEGREEGSSPAPSPPAQQQQQQQEQGVSLPRLTAPQTRPSAEPQNRRPMASAQGRPMAYGGDPPLPRTGACMALDPERALVIVFGGFREEIRDTSYVLRLMEDMHVFQLDQGVWSRVRVSESRPWIPALDFDRRRFPKRDDYHIAISGVRGSASGAAAGDDGDDDDDEEGLLAIQPRTIDDYIDALEANPAQYAAAAAAHRSPSPPASRLPVRRSTSGAAVAASPRRTPPRATALASGPSTAWPDPMPLDDAALIITARPPDAQYFRTGPPAKNSSSLSPSTVLEPPPQRHFRLPVMPPHNRTMAALVAHPTPGDGRFYLYGGRLINDPRADMFELTLDVPTPLQESYQQLLQEYQQRLVRRGHRTESRPATAFRGRPATATMLEGRGAPYNAMENSTSTLCEPEESWRSLQAQLQQSFLEDTIRRRSPFFQAVSLTPAGLRSAAAAFLQRSGVDLESSVMPVKSFLCVSAALLGLEERIARRRLDFGRRCAPPEKEVLRVVPRICLLGRQGQQVEKEKLWILWGNTAVSVLRSDMQTSHPATSLRHSSGVPLFQVGRYILITAPSKKIEISGRGAQLALLEYGSLTDHHLAYRFHLSFALLMCLLIFFVSRPYINFRFLSSIISQKFTTFLYSFFVSPRLLAETSVCSSSHGISFTLRTYRATAFPSALPFVYCYSAKDVERELRSRREDNRYSTAMMDPESAEPMWDTMGPPMSLFSTQPKISTPRMAGNYAPPVDEDVVETKKEPSPESASGGAGGLNPNATPFQFSAAAAAFQPPSQVTPPQQLGLGGAGPIDEAAAQQLLAAQQQALFQPYMDQMMMGAQYGMMGMPGGLYAGAGLLPMQQAGVGVGPGAAAVGQMMPDEVQVLMSVPYRAKVLPPPLPFAMHNKIWARNVCEVEEEDLGSEEATHEVSGGANGVTDDEKSPIADGAASEYSFSSEDAADKSQRLQAYRQTMDRWYRHIQILEEKPEIANRSSARRAGRQCKSYDEVLLLHRVQADGTMAADVDEEEVLRDWSDECVRWWRESSKKKTRRARKRKPEEMYTVKSVTAGGGSGATPQSSPDLLQMQLHTGEYLLHPHAGLSELDLMGNLHMARVPMVTAPPHPSAEAAATAASMMPEEGPANAPVVFSSGSALQFDDNIDDGDVSDGSRAAPEHWKKRSAAGTGLKQHEEKQKKGGRKIQLREGMRLRRVTPTCEGTVDRGFAHTRIEVRPLIKYTYCFLLDFNCSLCLCSGWFVIYIIFVIIIVAPSSSLSASFYGSEYCTYIHSAMTQSTNCKMNTALY
eukprot:gene498-271_t